MKEEFSTYYRGLIPTYVNITSFIFKLNSTKVFDEIRFTREKLLMKNVNKWYESHYVTSSLEGKAETS